MKILKIEFENINSLKGRHEINFEKAPFTESSLFAITGPTGSGKSTILDVIALALFNRIPRMPGNRTLSKTDILKFGAVLTRNQKEAFARITYETRTGKYTSKWEISTARTGNLRDHEMEIADLGSGKILDLKKSEVPSKNEELIGLSYEQFIKAVLLAQGEFAQLLKAEKKERGELLEKITGTGIYRQLGIRAYKRFIVVNAEIQDRQREKELLQKDLLEKVALEQLESQLHIKSESCGSLEKRIEWLDRQLELKKNIAEQAKLVRDQENLSALAAANLQQFNNIHLEKIEKHEQVQIFAEDLRAWQLLDKSCKELKQELTDHALQEQENLQGISSCLEKIQAFLRTTPQLEAIETSLQEFSKKIRKLQQERDQKLSTYKNLQERFHWEVREVPFKLQGELHQEELKLQELKLSAEKKLQNLKEQLPKVDLDQIEAEKARLRQGLQKGRRAQQKAYEIETIVKHLARARQEEETLLPQTGSLPKQIELSEAKAATFRERLKTLHLQRENQILTASLEQQRHELRKGEPCPLCGATEHPYAERLPEKNDQLQKEILEVQKSLETLEKQTTSFSTSLSHHKKRLSEIHLDLQEKQKQLKSEEEQFQREFGDLNPDEEPWESFCNSREESLQLLERFEQEKKKLSAILSGIKIIPEIKEVLLSGKKIKKELDSLYSGTDIDTDCLDLQNSWTSLQHQKGSLTKLSGELSSKLETRTAQLKAAEASLYPRISAIDCKEIKQALQRLLPEAEYLELRNKRERLLSEKQQAETSLKLLKDQLGILEKKDVEESTQVLSEQRSEVQSELLEIKEQCEELRRKQRNNTELLSKIRMIDSLMAGVKNSVRQWELLNHLIGDATGKKFNDFAQDLSLSQLLTLANRRLISLSDRYRIDRPLEDEDDSLVAIDDHMGGQRRSVKTLSGGETFLLSLAMALALSDLASKNVEINSLFIDEGFGTLDPETLDQTLDTLEKLQAESSKTIGIISHVDSLKDRIATQIKLSRNGLGYSSLEVTG